MYGAILGDIIGSPYEFDMGGKTKEFPLFSERSTFTDDTVMTLAVRRFGYGSENGPPFPGGCELPERNAEQSDRQWQVYRCGG